MIPEDDRLAAAQAATLAEQKQQQLDAQQVKNIYLFLL